MEIFEEIDIDYELYKKRIVDALDDGRNKLKKKFVDETELRKDEISKIKDSLGRIKSLDELDQDKKNMLQSMIQNLTDSGVVGNETYFSIFSFMNLDKNEEKQLKTLVGDVEEYKKSYQSKKFESFGRLFSNFQKASDDDNSTVSKIIEEFVDKNRKIELNKCFKKRIDNVFNTEMITNKVNFESDPLKKESLLKYPGGCLANQTNCLNKIYSNALESTAANNTQTDAELKKANSYNLSKINEGSEKTVEAQANPTGSTHVEKFFQTQVELEKLTPHSQLVKNLLKEGRVDVNALGDFTTKEKLKDSIQAAKNNPRPHPSEANVTHNFKSVKEISVSNEAIQKPNCHDEGVNIYIENQQDVHMNIHSNHQAHSKKEILFNQNDQPQYFNNHTFNVNTNQQKNLNLIKNQILNKQLMQQFSQNGNLDGIKQNSNFEQMKQNYLKG
jgi:hypothetical protein